MRLGIGHPGHKDRVTGYVLQDFAKADGDWLDDLMRGIGDGAPWLAQGKPERFQTAVAQRMVPERPAAKAPAPAPESNPGSKPETPAEEAQEDARTPLQRLVDRFR